MYLVGLIGKYINVNVHSSDAPAVKWQSTYCVRPSYNLTSNKRLRACDLLPRGGCTRHKGLSIHLKNDELPSKNKRTGEKATTKC